jgi:hypothetical protein
MTDGKWQIERRCVFAICHLPFAIRIVDPTVIYWGVWRGVRNSDVMGVTGLMSAGFPDIHGQDAARTGGSALPSS